MANLRRSHDPMLGKVFYKSKKSGCFAVNLYNNNIVSNNSNTSNSDNVMRNSSIPHINGEIKVF